MAEKKSQPVKEPHFCPFCEASIAEAAFPYCEACGVATFACPKCGKAVPRGKSICPHCGADIREEIEEGG